MFNGEFREKYRDDVVLEEVRPEVFEAFLKAVYPDGAQPTAENFADLMELAERYDVKSLRNKCECICRQRTEIPLVDRLKFAVHYRLGDFVDLLIESMDASAARQLASEENLASFGAQCMQKLFVKCTKFSSNGTA